MRNLILLVGIMIGFAWLFDVPKTVYGAPQDYAYDYNQTNIYDSGLIIYNLTTLDSAQEYTFGLYVADLETGEPTALLLEHLVGSGVTTAVITWGQFNASWQKGSHFPVVVRDNFGQILGRHFITPLYHPDWTVSGAVNADVKQAMNGAIYNPLNASNYHHDPELETEAIPTYVSGLGGTFLDADLRLRSITTFSLSFPTNRQDIAFLHYRREFPWVAPVGEIEIKDIATDTVLGSYTMADLECFAKDDFGASFGDIANTYIVIGTDGFNLPFVDNNLESTCFSTSDPVTHPLFVIPVPSSGYAYARLDAIGNLVSEGESVWFHSDSVNQEWIIDAQVDPVRQGTQQRLQRKQYTQGIHNGYNDQVIADTSGVIDSTNYPFKTSRTSLYTPTFVPTVDITWELKASDLRYGQDVNDFPMIARSSFTMISSGEPVTSGNRLRELISEFGLNDDLGSLLILIGGSLMLFYGLYLIGSPSFLYYITYLLWSVFLIVFGLFNPIIITLVILSDLVVLYGFWSNLSKTQTD